MRTRGVVVGGPQASLSRTYRSTMSQKPACPRIHCLRATNAPKESKFGSKGEVFRTFQPAELPRQGGRPRSIGERREPLLHVADIAQQQDRIESGVYYLQAGNRRTVGNRGNQLRRNLKTRSSSRKFSERVIIARPGPPPHEIEDREPKHGHKH